MGKLSFPGQDRSGNPATYSRICPGCLRGRWERVLPRPGWLAAIHCRRMSSALRALSALFFRELEVVGRADVPADRGGIVVSWHPNGLVDPWLILAHFPRPGVFGAGGGVY